MRVALLTLGTTLATAAVITNAFYQKKQFYPSVVYLTKSNPSIAVLYAQVFVLVLLFGKAMRKIFFGQLRASEVEHLIEKFWYVITETCLAFTVFRDDFSPKFVALFTFLLFTKAFHWLIEDRVDYMERSPVITPLFHLRVCSLLLLLGTMDAILIHHALKITIASGASVQMVFGFEYAILLMMVVAIMMKYVLHSIDYLSEHPWENKNVYLLYAELITGFIKCLLYIAFVAIMVKIHTFPLFAIRPMYLTIRGFKKSLSDVILSRKAIAYMNTRFPDAVEEELQQQDNTCIICREQMTSGKKLPCNHIFHAHCLRSWFQRQQSCPTCRLDVLSQASNAPATPAPNAGAPAAQQAAQPAVPQQPPVAPPNFAAPPFAAPNFPFVPNVVPPPTSSATATPVDTNSQAPPNPMFMPGFPPSPFMSGPSPFFMPPPPFMGSPMGPPPVFPSLHMDLSTLNIDQLREMEGQERENIEARISVLRNVHSLLDAAIVQLNQYSQVIQLLNQMSPPTTETTADTSSATNPTVDESKPSTSGTEPRIPPNLFEKPYEPSISHFMNSTKDQNGSEETVENISSSPIPPALSPDENLSSTELDSTTPDNELRRRRLEKFNSVKKEQTTDDDDLAEEVD